MRAWCIEVSPRMCCFWRKAVKKVKCLSPEVWPARVAKHISRSDATSSVRLSLAYSHFAYSTTIVRATLSQSCMYSTNPDSDSMWKSHEAICITRLRKALSTTSHPAWTPSCVDTCCSRCAYHMLIVTLPCWILRRINLSRSSEKDQGILRT
jgi:hypothetical protein